MDTSILDQIQNQGGKCNGPDRDHKKSKQTKKEHCRRIFAFYQWIVLYILTLSTVLHFLVKSFFSMTDAEAFTAATLLSGTLILACQIENINRTLIQIRNNTSKWTYKNGQWKPLGHDHQS